MTIDAVSAGRQIGERRGAADIDVETYKNCYDWFVVASTSDGQQRICTKENFEELLRGDILAGRLKFGKPVRVWSKRGVLWEESTPSLREFVQKHSKLRALYEPIHTRAVTGYWRGVLAGIGLSMLNSIIMYSMLDRVVAICLSAAVLAIFIPRFGQKIAMAPFALLGLMGKLAPVFGSIGAAFVFAFLFGITGMAIGGAIAWNWEDKLPRAPDAPAEPVALVQSVLLPLIGSILLWSVYIFVLYPWAVHLIGSPLTFSRTPSQP